jgi:hypothetical protein
MASTPVPQIGRLDRHVRRSYVHMAEGASRHRISYALEEALRLTNLPGEEEGRIYCFRSVSVAGIAGDRLQRVWMDRVQQVLAGWAEQAVHGTNAGAASAQAIYFHNLEEALEVSLRNALRARHRDAKPEWFSASILGLSPDTSYNQQIPAILTRLRPPAIAPSAAASILFAALGDTDSGTLLAAVSADTIVEWIRELDRSKNAENSQPIKLPEQWKRPLLQAASGFGWKDSKTVWLASQIVLLVAPSSWNAGSAVKRARSTLRMLESEQRLGPAAHSARTNRDSTRRLRFDDEQGSGNEPLLPSVSDAAYDLILRDPRASIPTDSLSAELLEPVDPISPERPLLGEVTSAAGLPFLLNVLQRLGIASALNTCPALADTELSNHIMIRLAVHASVAQDDAILPCFLPSQPHFHLAAELLGALHAQPSAWPSGFVAPSKIRADSGFLPRVWALAVRRWCWRMGKLTVPEIATRLGHVWLTRSDLDVTMPFEAVDVRIRRIGLDINPGWLPWFGVHGKVVRFHYSSETSR